MAAPRKPGRRPTSPPRSARLHALLLHRTKPDTPLEDHVRSREPAQCLRRVPTPRLPHRLATPRRREQRRPERQPHCRSQDRDESTLLVGAYLRRSGDRIPSRTCHGRLVQPRQPPSLTDSPATEASHLAAPLRPSCRGPVQGRSAGESGDRCGQGRHAHGPRSDTDDA